MMLKKRLVLIILFVILFPTVAYANVTSNINKLYINQSVTFEDNSLGESLFLFSNVTFTNHNGDIFVFFGNLKLNQTPDNKKFNGNIYLFFSEMELSGNINGTVSMFSSKCIVKNPDNWDKVESMLGISDVLLKESETQEQKVIDNTVPFFIAFILISGIRVLFFSLVFFIKRSFFEQGSEAFLHRPLRVVRNGLIIYFIFISLIVVFLLSVVGVVVSLLLLFLLYLLISCGEISLTIIIGYFLLKKIKILKFSFAYITIGVIIIELIKKIPYVGYFISFLIIPVAAIGIITTAVINGYINKEFYELSFY